jgi:Flp pilus assembly protein TadD
MLAYTKNGSPLQALRFHDAIRAQSQPNLQELIALGNALLHCSRSADALELADLAVRAAPSRSKAHVLRSKCLRLLGRRSEADLAKHQAADLRVNKAADGGVLN